MDMIDYQPGGRSGSTGGGVDPNTGNGSGGNNNSPGSDSREYYSGGGGNSSSSSGYGNCVSGPYGVPSTATWSSNITFREIISSQKYDIKVLGTYLSTLEITAELFSICIQSAALKSYVKHPGRISTIIGISSEVYQTTVRGENIINSFAKAGVHAVIDKASESIVAQIANTMFKYVDFQNNSSKKIKQLSEYLGTFLLSNKLNNSFDEMVERKVYYYSYNDPVYISRFGY